LAAAKRSLGYLVDINVGQSKFRCDLAVRANSDHLYQLGILVDTDGHYANPNLLDRYLMQPSILRAFGWRFLLVLTKDWYHNPEDVVARIEKILRGEEIREQLEPAGDEAFERVLPRRGSGSIQPSADSSPEAQDPANALRPDEPKRAHPGDSFSESSPQDLARAPHEQTIERTGPPVSAPEAPTPKPVPSAGPVGPVRHFEFIGGSSRKFWEISVAGNSFTVRFGRIGTSGQSQTKTFADGALAKREAEHLVAEKLKKGYTEKSV
jgi:predicted DNA-binding WGR domain protein